MNLQSVKLLCRINGQGKGIHKFQIDFVFIQLSPFVPALLHQVTNPLSALKRLLQFPGLHGFKVIFGQLLLNIAQSKCNILINRHIGPKSIVLEQKTYLSFISRHINSCCTVKYNSITNGYLPFCRRFQTCNHSQNCSLSTAGGAQKGDKGIIVNMKIQVIHRIKFSPPLCNVF